MSSNVRVSSSRQHYLLGASHAVDNLPLELPHALPDVECVAVIAVYLLHMLPAFARTT